MDMRKGIGRAAAFVALVFAVTYGIAFLYFRAGGTIGSPFAMPFFLLYMYIPALTVIFLQKAVYREGVIKPLDVSFRWNKWFLTAWFAMPICVLASIGVSLLLPGVHFDAHMTGLLDRLQSSMPPDQFAQTQHVIESMHGFFPFIVVGAGLIAGLIAGATVNAIAAFGEELGWRGFLAKNLGFMGFWPSSIVIGIIWGIWHAPLIIHGYNYPIHPKLGVLMMTVFTTLLSPIFMYVRLRAKSVIASSVMHGTLNAVAGLSLLFLKGGSDILPGMTGIAGFIVLFLANIGIFIYDRHFATEPVRMP
jgi:membrane protease YdiL (CAAX protease family)